MQAMFIYLFKAVLCSGLFAGYYWLFLRNRRLHGFNRVYLIVSVIASVILPALHFDWQVHSSSPVQEAYRLMEVVNATGADETGAVKTKPVISMEQIITILYALVSVAILVTTALRIRDLFVIKRKGNAVRCKGYVLVYTEHEKAPFSFLNMLFWKESVLVESMEGERILKHELAHIYQYHTLDKMFIQLVLTFFWCNPFFWLLRKELALVHEFMADEVAIEDRDTESFARMLLQEYCGNSYPGIVHPFFYSSVKRRLFMLNQLNKPSLSGLRRWLALPLLGVAALLFSFSVSDVPVVKANKTVTLVLDAGHGGEDNGAVAANGVKEKDLALRITQHLAAIAKSYNVKVATTRSRDESVKLQDRPARANALAADVLVSIHVQQREDNAMGDFNGFDIMIGKNAGNYSKSRELGSAIASGLRDININSRLVDKGLHVLRNANMPAVLIECGYVNNADDVARINSDKELDRFCRSIMSGVVAYYNAN